MSGDKIGVLMGGMCIPENFQKPTQFYGVEKIEILSFKFKILNQM